MINLLIAQNYNANKGDSSVVQAILESLSNDDINIEISSYNVAQGKQEYNLNCVGWMLSFYQIKNAKSKLNALLYFLREGIWLCYSFFWAISFRIGLKLPVPRFKKATINAYRTADVIILPGGHFFTNLNNFPVIISHFWGLYFGKIIGKKTMIYGQTIGDYFGKWGSITKWLTHFLIKRTDMVTLREKNSLKNCPETENIHVTNEIVFLSKVSRDLPESMRENVRVDTIGVTIHHIYYKHFFTKEEYVNLMSRIFDLMVYKTKYKLLIIPMESNIHSGGDRPIAQEMIDRCEHSDQMSILGGDLTPESTTSVISSMNLFIGTKTHSIVYGLKTLVPTISISYQEKSNQFMESFDVLHNAINLKDLTVEGFEKIFQYVIDNTEEVVKTQSEALLRVKEEAESNNKLLRSLFSNE